MICVAGVDFWSEVGPHSEQVDLMVEPSQVSKVICHGVITTLLFFGTISQEYLLKLHIYFCIVASFIFSGCQSYCVPTEQWH